MEDKVGAESGIPWAVAKLLLAGALVFGTVDAAPPRPAGDQARTESLLMIKGEADSVDFRLIDPLGRLAVIALDSAMSAILECSVEKSSDFRDHDDSDFDSDSLDLRPFGGGVFTLEDPAAGVWYLDALATRVCEDSCGVTVYVWSMKHVNQDGRFWLRPGEGARWRLTLAPLAQREGRVWARMELERRTTISELGSGKP